MKQILFAAMLATGCIDEQNVGSARDASQVIGTARWSLTLGDIGLDEAMSTAIASNGDVFVVGDFTGTVDFGGSVFDAGPANRNGDGLPCYMGFLSRRAATDGHELWTRTFATTDSWPTRIAITPDDGFVAIGTKLIAGAGVSQLMRLDTMGNVVWTHDFALPFWIGGFAIDASGRVAVVGEFKGTVDFPGGSVTSPSGDAFVELFDANGTPIWAAASSNFGGGSGGFSSVAFTPEGDLVAVGEISTPISFAGALLANNAFESSIAARFTIGGALEWAKVTSDAGFTQYGGLLATDASGNAYVATSRAPDNTGDPRAGMTVFQTVDAGGEIASQRIGEPGLGGGAQTMAFVDGTLISVDRARDGAATELNLGARDTSGDPLANVPFGPQIGGPSDNSLFRAIAHRDGTLAMVGSVDKPADLGTGTLRFAGGSDIAIAVYDLPSAP